MDVYVRGVEYTGAKAVKFKIGGRMSDNQDAYPGRTENCWNGGEKLAGKVTLMADPMDPTARKSYRIGKRLQEMKYLWFEEPCPGKNSARPGRLPTRFP